MTAIASRAGSAAQLAAAFRITSAANSLRERGAEPQRALRTALNMGEGNLAPEIEALARAIWAVVVNGTGDAGLDTLPRILGCAETLCSLGVEPCEAIGVLQWVDAPNALKAIARDAWAAAVGSGAVARADWSYAMPSKGSGPGGAAVANLLSSLLGLADRLCSVGIEPANVLHVLRLVGLPPGLAAVVRAAWAFVAGFDGDEPGHLGGGA